MWAINLILQIMNSLWWAAVPEVAGMLLVLILWWRQRGRAERYLASAPSMGGETA